MRYVVALMLLLLGGQAWLSAAESKPVYKWVSANEYYFLLPAAGQTLDISGGGSDSVKPWGFGFRAVGQDTFSKTGGLQFQMRIPGQTRPPFRFKPYQQSNPNQTTVPDQTIPVFRGKPYHLVSGIAPEAY